MSEYNSQPFRRHLMKCCFETIFGLILNKKLTQVSCNKILQKLNQMKKFGSPNFKARSPGINPDNRWSGSEPIQKKFHGHSSIDWMIFLPKFRRAFIENECWDYVDPSPAHVLDWAAAALLAPPGPGGLPVVEAVLEELFDTPRPIANEDAVTAFINQEILESLAVFTANSALLEAARIPAAPAVPTAEQVLNNETYQRALLNQRQDLGTRNFNIRRNRPVILKRLMDAVVQYDKDKKIHAEKQSKCMKVFTTYLSESALSIVREELNEFRFRKAYTNLNKHFALSVGGTQNVSEIFAVLNAIVFKPNKCTLSQHIENMLVIANEVTLFGNRLDDSMILNYILTSIENSKDRSFDEDCAHVRRFDLTLAQAITLFQKTESRLAVKREVDHLNEKKIKSPRLQHALLTDEKSPSKRQRVEIVPCTNPGCLKPKGHTTSQCWLSKPCPICDKPGHFVKDCPDKPKRMDASPAKVSVTDVFAKKMKG
jgi:hypothetical protein